jgi:hypothetical protein
MQFLQCGLVSGSRQALDKCVAYSQIISSMSRHITERFPLSPLAVWDGFTIAKDIGDQTNVWKSCFRISHTEACNGHKATYQADDQRVIG